MKKLIVSLVKLTIYSEKLVFNFSYFFIRIGLGHRYVQKDPYKNIQVEKLYSKISSVRPITYKVYAT